MKLTSLLENNFSIILLFKEQSTLRQQCAVTTVSSIAKAAWI